MAFHFNWSPLIADTDRVRHMLTSSLNRSPKPPIIVGDIHVNELNLGSTPPSLEILEIGDIAEDRFRGIFKVKYEGDAYLQLRTQVQANPLNTFLSTRPGFASPNPLAAGSGLTIPLQITLSDIRLAGFVILVFSKQKGITLVFRNDPLESLKVSSTFDSIPFVREYLQRTIEGQLRVLFVEDLPAIIHRLSLKVFNSEFGESGSTNGDQSQNSKLSEPNERSNASPQSLDDGGAPSIFPGSDEAHGDSPPLFSQSNLLRLAALTESQRTLSLFTPTIPDVIYRAGAGAHECNERPDSTPQRMPTTLSRIQSQLNISHAGWSSAASQVSDTASQTTRPSLANYSSLSAPHSIGSGRTRGHATRKRKHRVVNLRKNRNSDGDGASDNVSLSSGYTESADRTESASATGSTDSGGALPTSTSPTASFTDGRSALRHGEIQTPPWSPQKQNGRPQSGTDPVVHLNSELASTSTHSREMLLTPRPPHAYFQADESENTPRASTYLPSQTQVPAQDVDLIRSRNLPRMQTMMAGPPAYQKPVGLQRTTSDLSISDLAEGFSPQGSSTGGILEQAWVKKMATEIAQKVEEEKKRREGSQDARSWGEKGFVGESEAPPPAYFS